MFQNKPGDWHGQQAANTLQASMKARQTSSPDALLVPRRHQSLVKAPQVLGTSPYM